MKINTERISSQLLNKRIEPWRLPSKLANNSCTVGDVCSHIGTYHWKEIDAIIDLLNDYRYWSCINSHIPEPTGEVNGKVRLQAEDKAIS